MSDSPVTALPTRELRRRGGGRLSLCGSSWPIVLLFVVAGVLFGLARLDPSLAICAWGSVACLAAALTREQTTAHALVGALATFAIAIFVGFPWLAGMNHALFAEWSNAQLAGLLFGEYVVSAGLSALGIGVAHGVLRRWLPVQVWLPLGWALGEVIRTAVLVQTLEDWLVTQWQNSAVLHLLAFAGWWPTLLLSLAAAAAVGEALTLKAPRRAILPVIFALTLLFLPAPDRGAVDQLENIGAVHLENSLTLIAAEPRDHDHEIDVYLWPETALNMRPRIAEGTDHVTRISPLLGESNANHILGVQGHTPGIGLRNALMSVRADGSVAAVRAKRLLMPLTERRAFGPGRIVSNQEKRLQFWRLAKVGLGRLCVERSLADS